MKILNIDQMITFAEKVFNIQGFNDEDSRQNVILALLQLNKQLTYGCLYAFLLSRMEEEKAKQPTQRIIFDAKNMVYEIKIDDINDVLDPSFIFVIHNR